MKKLLLILACFFTLQAANAQIVGLKLGVNTYDVSPQDVNIPQNGTDDFVLKLTDAGYGLHGGVFVRVPVGNLYVQGDVLLSSSSMSYTLDSANAQQIFADSKTFVNLNVPIVVGYTIFDLLRVNAGVVGSYTLNNQSDLFSSADYSSTWNNMTWGYTLGAGVDFRKFTVDASFQGAINKFGNEVTVSGNSYELDSRPTSFVISLGYRLIGD